MSRSRFFQHWHPYSDPHPEFSCNILLCCAHGDARPSTSTYSIRTASHEYGFKTDASVWDMHLSFDAMMAVPRLLNYSLRIPTYHHTRTTRPLGGLGSSLRVIRLSIPFS